MPQQPAQVADNTRTAARVKATSSSGNSNSAPSKWRPQETADYRPDIDGLRAVAVVAVIVFHCSPEALPGGFTGVDMFFVVSGFVVAGSLLRRKPTQGMALASLAGFYSRRIQRIQPALVLMVAVSGTLGAMIVPPWEAIAEAQRLTAMSSLVGFANVFILASGGVGSGGGGGEATDGILLNANYFAHTVAGEEVEAHTLDWNAYTHCWSLGVEEQFYLFFPLLLLMRRPLYGILGCMALSAALCVYLTVAKPHQAFFLMPARFWELGSGAAAYMLAHAKRHGASTEPSPSRWTELLDAHRALRATLGALAVVMLSLSFAYAEGETLFPLPWSLLSVGGTLAFLGAGHGASRHYRTKVSTGLSVEQVSPTSAGGPLRPAFPLFNRVLALHPCVYVGKLSYTLYLWHWPLLVGLRWLDLWHAGPIVAAIALAGLFSVATYHLLEGPYPMCVVCAGARELSVKPRIVLTGCVEFEREQDLPGAPVQ